ncbi:MAG: DJ-1/PfpI family protein [Clostridia bacterium]|nr:DJ-1/PfpI family protein [Clostridia bacterium]
MTYVFLAEGFEEIEALTPVDLLRRAGEKTVTVGVTGKLVTGSHGIGVTADITIEEAAASKTNADMIVLPGGLPGADNLRENAIVREFISRADRAGAYIAAICAAPRILGELGLLEGKQAVCYPGFEKYLRGAKISDAHVVRDTNIITGIGMGAATEFSLALVEALVSKEESDKLRKGIIA